MTFVPVAARPHAIVATAPQRCRALFALTIAVSFVACDGSSVAPTPGPQASTPPPQPGPSSPSVPTAPYTVTGTVTDSRGTRVASAEVWVYGQQSPIDNRYATGTTDGGGRYTLVSPERFPQHVRALKNGYITRDVMTLPSPSGSTWTVDVPMQRIESYRLLSPTVLKVGQNARIEAQVQLDDGSTSTGLLYSGPISSSDESVASAQPTGWVIATAPGTATISATYYGVAASLPIRVDP